MTIGGRCRECGVEHDRQVGLPEPGDDVVVTAGKYAGATGVVRQWSIYGGPMYYRLQLDDPSQGDSYGRCNVAPCEIVPWHAAALLHAADRRQQ